MRRGRLFGYYSRPSEWYGSCSCLVFESADGEVLMEKSCFMLGVVLAAD
jgi:hypothetical protein